MNSRFKPPLTTAQLQEIQARNQGNPDVYFLLWEIKRLHEIMRLADQLQRSLGDVGAGANLILGALRRQLEGDPILADDQAWRNDLLSPK